MLEVRISSGAAKEIALMSYPSNSTMRNDHTSSTALKRVSLRSSMKRETSKTAADAMGPPSRSESGRGAVDQLLERALLQVLVEPPALHLLEYLLEFLAWNRPVDE